MKSKELKLVNTIYNELISYDLSGNIGLHGGTSGVALFLTYYDHLILGKQEISKKICDILEFNINWINSGKKIHTICRGFSGFGWTCEHLVKMGILDNDDIDFLNELDPILYKQMIYDVRHNNYEFLHGAIGTGLYFLSRFEKNKESAIYLERLITELENTGISCENNTIKWISTLNFETGQKGCDISMSHGMSGLVAFLIKLFLLGFEVGRVKKLLVGVINYILKQVTYKEGNLSYFPTHSKEGNYGLPFSRLAWCYGDLSIAHALLRASIVMNDNELGNIALKILFHSCNRLDLQSNGVYDTGLCHGTSGIAHIFWNLYLNTHIQKFKDVSAYWIHQTTQMMEIYSDRFNLKSYKTGEYGKYANSVSLLEGLAGVGLALLSQLTEEKLVWDESLMLS